MTHRRVLITGTSTGIGSAAARLLAERGWRVYAGVRREADAESWRSAGVPDLTPLFCDVTSPEQIRGAVKTLENEGEGLEALVNNAGVSAAGPLEYLETDELRRTLEVNVIGQQAVTRACLPLLRRGRGRIVFVGSVSGRTSMPLVGAYCMSKFALEALADAWRIELRPWGVGVILLEPGPIATPIWDKVAAERKRHLAELEPEALNRYGPLMEAVFRHVVESARRARGPEEVAVVIERVLTRRRPRARYVVGRGARSSVLTGKIPDRLRDWLIARALGHEAPPSGASTRGE